MPSKKIVVKRAPAKGLGAAVKQSLNTIKKAVYRSANNQPKNII